VEDTVNDFGFNWVRGFNYNPSTATSLNGMWLDFDPALWARELGFGRLFGMNVVRVWLDPLAWREDRQFLRNVERAFGVIQDTGAQVIPCLFNRWRDPYYDFGGLHYEDMRPEEWAGLDDYVVDVLRAFGKDERVLMWDIVNEPRTYDLSIPECAHEIEFVRRMAHVAREAGPTAPITIRAQRRGNSLSNVESLSDVLGFSLYVRDSDLFESECQRLAQVALRSGKRMLCLETGTGHERDRERAEIVQMQTSVLNQQGVGWVLWQLMAGEMASARIDRPCPGNGYMPFVAQDGSPRGHLDFLQTGRVAT
jgi:hypothetical protein